jgi:hypothetical protein
MATAGLPREDSAVMATAGHAFRLFSLGLAKPCSHT